MLISAKQRQAMAYLPASEPVQQYDIVTVFSRPRWRCSGVLAHIVLLVATATILAALSGSVYGHFLLNLNTRIVHAEHRLDKNQPGLDVYLRIPMPYLVAGPAGEVQGDDDRESAPYTRSVDSDGELQHFIDISALQADPLGLGKYASDGHHWSTGGEMLVSRVAAVRVYALPHDPPFASLADAKASIANEQPLFDTAPFVGDSVVDVLLTIDTDQPLKSYQFSSSLNPGLEGQEATANLVLDYFADDVAVYQDTGLLDVPLQISRSVWSAVTTFTIEGFRHIIAGYDHVLFVVCLVLGAISLGALVWRITGFTIGHSVTLSLGFFGFVPASAWFVPAVELLIALSIVVAALYVVARPANVAGQVTGASGVFVITALIGLLHGLGFSFVLHEILKVSSPNLWHSLLAFNIGVELGQLSIILLMWPSLLLIGRISSIARRRVTWVLAALCLFIGSTWIGERVILLFQASGLSI